MLISICIPCYKSEKTLPILIASIKDEFAKHPGYSYQIILVNDCSPDSTFSVIQKLVEFDENIIGVDLSRNFGQTAARLAALQYATGEIVISMDDDGQHPAEGIFMLVDKMLEGNYDVVYAYFQKKSTSAFKVVASNLHNWIAESMGNKPKGVHRSSFAAWSRTVADAMKNYHSPFPSAGSYLMHVTNSFAEVPIEHRERMSGKSGYTFWKLFFAWLNSFISFSMVPIRWVSRIGGIFTIFGLIWGIALVVRKITNPAIAAGYTSTIVLMLVIGGLILFSLGLIGEFVGRTYMTVSNMPQYNVRRVIGRHVADDALGAKMPSFDQ